MTTYWQGQTTSGRAVINRATTGTVVEAVTGRSIMVVSVVLVCSAANVVTWRSGTTAISGAMSFGANGGYAMARDEGVFATAEGEALTLLLGSAEQVSGHISYVLV